MTRRGEGVRLRLLAQAGTTYQPALLTFAREFEEQTGAAVEFEFVDSWWKLSPTLQAALAGRRPGFDIFCNDFEFQYELWPHLLSLDELIAQSGYNMQGFFEPIYRYDTKVARHDGTHFGLPLRVRVPLVFYRRDLIPVLPDSWEGLEAAMAENTGHERYGLGFWGLYEHVLKLFVARYRASGDPFLTPEGQPLINSDAGVTALEALKRQIVKYASPDVLGWDSEYAAYAFAQGRVAILEGLGALSLPFIEDPVLSEVRGRWAIGLYPGSGASSFTRHHMVISKTSANPEAAFAFAAHCTGEEGARRLLTEYGEHAARKAVWLQPQILQRMPYLARAAEAVDRGIPFTPGVPQWLPMMRALWEGVFSCVCGSLPAPAALNEVAARWTSLVTERPLEFPYAE